MVSYQEIVALINADERLLEMVGNIWSLKEWENDLRSKLSHLLAQGSLHPDQEPVVWEYINQVPSVAVWYSARPSADLIEHFDTLEKAREFIAGYDPEYYPDFEFHLYDVGGEEVTI